MGKIEETVTEIDNLIEEMDDFDRACAENDYTDVGEAWDVFRFVRSRLHKIKTNLSTKEN